MAKDGKRVSLRKVFPAPSDRLTLNNALRVSPYCIGIVSDPDTISHAFDRGVNFFFVTADMHWPAYEATRRGLRDLLARSPSVRDEIVVAAVAYVTQPEFCHVPFQEVLDEVPALKRLDVTVAGGSYRSDFAVRKEQFAKHGPFGARAFGVSFHERRMAATALSERLVDLGFIRYNAAHRGAEKDIFPHLARGKRARPLVYNFTNTTGFIRPELFPALGLNDDYWRPPITDYYRFVLGRPEIDGLLCAPHTPAQLDGLFEAVQSGPLTDEERTYLADLTDLAGGRARLAEGAAGKA